MIIARGEQTEPRSWINQMTSVGTQRLWWCSMAQSTAAHGGTAITTIQNITVCISLLACLSHTPTDPKERHQFGSW